MIELLRGIAVRFEAIKMAQRRGRHVEDVSEDKEEEVATREQGANPSTNDPDEERFIRALSRENTRPHFTPLYYDGKLDSDELLDWIMEVEKYFNFEGTAKDRKVRYACTKLKSHASLWCKHLQVDRQRRGKEKIKSWEWMVSKLKSKFMTIDYQVNLF